MRAKKEIEVGVLMLIKVLNTEPKKSQLRIIQRKEKLLTQGAQLNFRRETVKLKYQNKLIGWSS